MAISHPRSALSSAAALSAEVTVNRSAFTLEAELAVERGEVIGVVGPNGAGKSTLLHALAGLAPLSGGWIAVADQAWDHPERGLFVPVRQRRVGVVFQDYLLFPHLSVAENVAFGLRTRGTPRREARRRAGAWLQRVGLESHTRQRPGTLSGGQAQRAALARALASEPDVLLLDEPLAAVDPDARQQLRRELRHHLEAFDGPCLLVSHEPVEALALAHRLLVIEDGQITHAGPAMEVAQRPRSAWAAGLAGINLYHGRWRGDHLETAAGSRIVASHSGPEELARDEEAFAVVHPHAVALYRDRPEGTPRNVWRASVETVDVQGDRVRVGLGGELAITAEVTPQAMAALDLGAGGSVWVSVKASEVAAYTA